MVKHYTKNKKYNNNNIIISYAYLYLCDKQQNVNQKCILKNKNLNNNVFT